MGDLTTQKPPGRISDKQINYYNNHNGTGSSEMAIAMPAYKLARHGGRGMIIELIEIRTLNWQNYRRFIFFASASQNQFSVAHKLNSSQINNPREWTVELQMVFKTLNKNEK